MGGDLLTWHVLSVGIWTGCIATEIFFEKLLLKQSHEVNSQLARLHYYVDKFIELPISTLTLITGTELYRRSHQSALITTKALFGVSAVVMNLICFKYVRARYFSSLEENEEEFYKNDLKQHKFGKATVHSLLSALAIGLYLSFH